jgi:hypothetical protein
MRRIRPLIDLLSEDHSEAEENGKHRLLARAVVTAGSAPEARLSLTEPAAFRRFAVAGLLSSSPEKGSSVDACKMVE